jgi:hypothetical protein
MSGCYARRGGRKRRQMRARIGGCAGSACFQMVENHGAQCPSFFQHVLRHLPLCGRVPGQVQSERADSVPHLMAAWQLPDRV